MGLNSSLWKSSGALVGKPKENLLTIMKVTMCLLSLAIALSRSAEVEAHANGVFPVSYLSGDGGNNETELQNTELLIIQSNDENTTGITDNNKQLVEPCAIISCNRKYPRCCEGYHCSLQILMFGGLGFCHYNSVPNAPPAPPPAPEPAPAPAPAPSDHKTSSNSNETTLV